MKPTPLLLLLLLSANVIFTLTRVQAQTVTDADGNIYNTVTIGTQVWMKENLKVTHYRNGDLIPNITDTAAWRLSDSGARCYFDNDSISYCATYGALYNWYAVNDKRAIAPDGWHIPTESDWNKLEIYLDYTVDTNATEWLGTNIGGKLKEAGYVHWLSPNIGATNSSGFTALPGGGRSKDGLYGGIFQLGDWWAINTYDSTTAWKRYLYYYTQQIERSMWFKNCGWSVRCVRNQPAGANQWDHINELIRISPNLATDRLFINYDGRQAVELKIYDMTGKMLMQKTCTGNPDEIDIACLSKGIYLLRLTIAEGTLVKKFIKE
jgi:uncharacterized protein (TIGR02145 family)